MADLITAYTTNYSSGIKDTNSQVKNSNQTLGKDAFLTLLIAQMKYQDPLNPMDNKESMSQMAQFSSLEQMQNLNKSFENFSVNQKMTNSLVGASMIGKNVEVAQKKDVTTKDSEGKDITTTETTYLKGKVTGISYKDGIPLLNVLTSDNKTISSSMDQISAVNDNTSQDINVKTQKINSVIAGASMIGREVTGLVDGVSVTGRVASVSFKDGNAVLKMVSSDNKNYTMNMENVENVV